VRVAARLAEERAPAAAAEGPRAVVRRAEADEPGLAGLEVELAARDREPGDEGRAVAALAHRAVAMAAEERGQCDAEADRSAQAGPRDPRIGHGPSDAGARGPPRRPCRRTLPGPGPTRDPLPEVAPRVTQRLLAGRPAADGYTPARLRRARAGGGRGDSGLPPEC